MDQFLSDASRIAQPRGGIPASLDRLARTAVPGFADFCLVYALEGDRLRCVALAHATPAGDRLLRALNRVYKITRDHPESTVARVVRLGRPSLRTEILPEHQAPDTGVPHLSRILDLHRRLSVRSALVVPVKGRHGTLGAVALSYARSGRRYTRADQRTAARFAGTIARLLDRTHPAATPCHPSSGRRIRRLRARP